MSQGSLKYNRELAAEYLGYLKEMAQDFGLDYDMKVSALSRYPDVFTMEEQSLVKRSCGSCLEQPLMEACEKFVAARERRGRAPEE